MMMPSAKKLRAQRMQKKEKKRNAKKEEKRNAKKEEKKKCWSNVKAVAEPVNGLLMDCHFFYFLHFYIFLMSRFLKIR